MANSNDFSTTNHYNNGKDSLLNMAAGAATPVWRHCDFRPKALQLFAVQLMASVGSQVDLMMIRGCC